MALQKKIPRDKIRNLQNIIAILVINSLYVIGTMAYGVVHLTTTSKDGVCYSDTHREIALLILEAVIMAWSIVNILIFFVMSKDYRREIKAMVSHRRVQNRKNMYSPRCVTYEGRTRRRFKCHRCRKKFASDSQLGAHVLKTHVEELEARFS